MLFIVKKMFCASVISKIGNRATYYPFFLSPNYDFLQYSPYYHNQSAKLKIDVPNMYQLEHINLIKHLTKQIQQDKNIFLKEKQLVFVGRSNSGKSSLINRIFSFGKDERGATKKKIKIARTAKRPGSTQFLHFHHIKNMEAFVVDCPGYGFAKMNKRRRGMWFGLTEQYLKISSRVSQIFLCINFQHGLKQTDVDFLRRVHNLNINIQIIMTKVDKIAQKKFFPQLQAINEQIRRHDFKNINDRIIACSTKNDFGAQIVRCRVFESIEKSKQRNIDQSEDLLLTYLKQLRINPIENPKITQKQLTKQYIVRKLIYNSKLTKYLM